MAKLEDVCPPYVGRRNIILALKKPLDPLLAHRPILITVDVQDEAITSGLVLPLELRIVAPTPSNFRQHFFTRNVPRQFAITAREGGQHLISLREVAHCRWSGALVLDIVGGELAAAIGT